MSAGKNISLEEVRRNPKLLRRFIKQHESKGDLHAFEAALGSMIRTPPATAKASGAARGAGSSGTRTRQGSDEGT